MCSKCKEFHPSPAVHFLCVRFSSLLIIVGFGLFIYYGITIVLPAGRATHFQETKCFVNYSVFDGEVVCDCVAGFSVSSCYPCLEIHVAFSTENGEKLTLNASKLNVKSILHEDLWSMNSECSFSPPSCCSRFKPENTRKVLDYMERTGRNSTWIACHYNRFNQTEVIATLGNYKLSIFMAIFWPVFATVIGFCLFKYLKKLKPGTVTEITKADRRKMLVLSTMAAFLNTDGRPAAYLQNNSVTASRDRRDILYM